MNKSFFIKAEGIDVECVVTKYHPREYDTNVPPEVEWFYKEPNLLPQIFFTDELTEKIHEELIRRVEEEGE